MIDDRIFVLQIGAEHGRLRATLRAVEESEAQRFDDVQRLCRYVAGLAGEAVAPPASPRGEAGSATTPQR